MKNPLVDFLSCLSRATLDPALGGRGLALSRLLSLATFAAARGDDEAQATLTGITTQMAGVLNDNRDLRHEEWNDLQASAEAGHWFLRTSFPQRAAGGGIVGGHVETTPVASQEPPGAAIDPVAAEVPKPEASVSTSSTAVR